MPHSCIFTDQKHYLIVVIVDCCIVQVLVVAAGSGDVEGGMEGSAQSERWNLNLTLLT